MDCCESRPSGPIPPSVPTDPGEKVVFHENPSPGISLWRGGRVEEGGDARRPIAKVTNILFKNINTQNIEEMLDITTISPFGNLSPS